MYATAALAEAAQQCERFRTLFASLLLASIASGALDILLPFFAILHGLTWHVLASGQGLPFQIFLLLEL